MPLVDAESAGIDESESYPWVKKDDVVNVPVAIVQAWGYLNGAKADDKFQVCYLLQLLQDAFDANGEAIPLFFCVSMDADTKDNPRRQVLSHFADRSADPIGPVSLQQVPAQNQNGWVWAFRKCPLPVGIADQLDQIVRILYRQNWQQRAIAGHHNREAARRALIKPQNGTAAPALAAGATQEDLPF